jgi:hypothetical protein
MSYSPTKRTVGRLMPPVWTIPDTQNIHSDAAKIGIIFHSRNFFGSFFCEVQEK